MTETATPILSDLERFPLLQGEVSMRLTKLAGLDCYLQQLAALVFYDALLAKNSIVTPDSVNINGRAVRPELIDCAARALVLAHHHRHGVPVDIMQVESYQHEAFVLFQAKNHDYGDGFKTYGSVGVIIRLRDKLKRVQQLTRVEARVKSESICDTLMDAYNYCLMAVLLIDAGI